MLRVSLGLSSTDKIKLMNAFARSLSHDNTIYSPDGRKATKLQDQKERAILRRFLECSSHAYAQRMDPELLKSSFFNRKFSVEQRAINQSDVFGPRFTIEATTRFNEAQVVKMLALNDDYYEQSAANWGGLYHREKNPSGRRIRIAPATLCAPKVGPNTNGEGKNYAQIGAKTREDYLRKAEQVLRDGFLGEWLPTRPGTEIYMLLASVTITNAIMPNLRSTMCSIRIIRLRLDLSMGKGTRSHMRSWLLRLITRNVHLPMLCRMCRMLSVQPRRSIRGDNFVKSGRNFLVR